MPNNKRNKGILKTTKCKDVKLIFIIIFKCINILISNLINNQSLINKYLFGFNR